MSLVASGEVRVIEKLERRLGVRISEVTVKGGEVVEKGAPFEQRGEE